MSRQYTFKTTKDTLWIEDILDNIPGNQRSQFIRDILAEVLLDTKIKGE